ncbi:GtrA family protein [bacterium]|nr:GtrA family protein [bacterium]
MNKEKTQKKLSAKENLLQVAKFVFFSCGAGIIQFGSFTLLNELLHLNYWVSYLIALVLSILYNFTFNRKFTFKSASNIPVAMALVFLFYVAFTPYSTWLTDFLTMKKGLNEYLVLIICMVQNLVLEFLWCRFVVYRKSINSNALAKKQEENKNKTEVNINIDIHNNIDNKIEIKAVDKTENSTEDIL